VTPALWLLLGLAIGVAIALPAVVVLHRELAAARTTLYETARQAVARADHLGELLDRVRAEVVPLPPPPPEQVPPPLPAEIEELVDGFVDPDVQEEMRARARLRLSVDPLADPARVAEELIDG
jgi:hypothetical protein